jgi:prepilin-type N-terminal cleavage/methylation domain-containing protein
MPSPSRGFTLIELLVVIAIIGLLAGIVIVSITQLRQRGADSRVTNNIRQMRWLAEIAFSSQNNSYLNWPAYNTADYNKLIDDLTDTGVSSGDIKIGKDQPLYFCASAPLISDSSKIVCVDASAIIVTGAASCSVTAPHVCQ